MKLALLSHLFLVYTWLYYAAGHFGTHIFTVRDFSISIGDLLTMVTKYLSNQ